MREKLIHLNDEVSIRDCGGVSKERRRAGGSRAPAGVSIRDCGGVSKERKWGNAADLVTSQSATVAG